MEVLNLWKSYGSVLALRDISFRIDKKGVVGLIGPNGAGKTTLVRILTCQLKQTMGRAFVLGYEVGRDDEEIKKRIALLPQAVSAHYSLLNPFEYIYCYLRIRGMRKADARSRALKTVKEFGINFWNKNVAELSGGMIRKVLLAMILSYDAEIYFLDEPTVGLDPLVRLSFWEKIREKAEGSLIFITSHYMEEISGLCDEVLLLNKGRLLERGPPEMIAKVLTPKFEKKIVVLGQVRNIDRWDSVSVGRHTYIYLEDKNEFRKVIDKLAQSGLPFSIREITIEDYFILQKKIDAPGHS